MTFIVPFEAEFCGKTRTIYAVNEDNPENVSGHVTTSEPCPRCKEWHIYRVYEPKTVYEEDDYVIEVYDCKCPKCRNKFDLKIEFEL